MKKSKAVECDPIGSHLVSSAGVCWAVLGVGRPLRGGVEGELAEVRVRVRGSPGEDQPYIRVEVHSA